VNRMPKLRFAALNNPEYHEVIATSYEADDEVVTLHGVTLFDGKVSPPWPRGGSHGEGRDSSADTFCWSG
jgi:hypothetical protein